MAVQSLKDKMVKVLHIIKDDKFFDSTIETFEADKRLANRCVLIVDTPNYNFKFIKSRDKVKLLFGKEKIKKELSGDYDVIYFHSIMINQYRCFKYIPDDKIVIWWCWGFELYSSVKGMKPLLPMPLYRLRTRQYIGQTKNLSRVIKDLAKKVLNSCVWTYRRNKVLMRVDYFQPVLPIEYSLLKINRHFKAQEFYSNRSLDVFCDDTTQYGKGNILFGNSATYTNNHLDVWERIRKYVPSESEVFVPLNYGYDGYAEGITDVIGDKGLKVSFLRTFLPKEEYFSLLESCSFAIFGILRQQAMGNIYFCVQHGIKVFLYKDSLIYKYLSDAGYIVFTIEDVNIDSFRVPLTEEQIAQNRSALRKDAEYRNSIYEKVIGEIIEKKNGYESR